LDGDDEKLMLNGDDEKLMLNGDYERLLIGFLYLSLKRFKTIGG
jgi:hypothetical protein